MVDSASLSDHNIAEAAEGELRALVDRKLEERRPRLRFMVLKFGITERNNEWREWKEGEGECMNGTKKSGVGLVLNCKVNSVCVSCARRLFRH